MKAVKTKLALEALEGRDCPSVTFRLQDGGQTLVIKGDAAADTVHITQDDVNDTLSLTYNGKTSSPQSNRANVQVIQSFKSSKISRIVVDLGAGDDSFTYDLAAGTSLVNGKTFQVKLGDGNDLANFITGDQTMGSVAGGAAAIAYSDSSKADGTDMPPEIIFGSKQAYLDWLASQAADAADTRGSSIQSVFKLNLNAGDGDDQVKVDLSDLSNGAHASIQVQMGDGNDFFCSSGNAVGAGSLLRLSADGGEGDDTLYAGIHGMVEEGGSAQFSLNGQNGADQLTMDQTGAALGKLTVSVLGGAGDDQMNVIANFTPESGKVKLQVQGNDGDDNLSVEGTLEGFGPSQNLPVKLHGGRGEDRATLAVTLPTESFEFVKVLSQNEDGLKV